MTEGKDEEKEEKKRRDSVSGLIFVGCMFIGAGIGYAAGEVEVGGAIGMGVGFILMGLIRAKVLLKRKA